VVILRRGHVGTPLKGKSGTWAAAFGADARAKEIKARHRKRSTFVIQGGGDATLPVAHPKAAMANTKRYVIVPPNPTFSQENLLVLRRREGYRALRGMANLVVKSLIVLGCVGHIARRVRSGAMPTALVWSKTFKTVSETSNLCHPT